MNFDYKDFFKRLREKVAADDILGNSAQVAFYFTFALFPLLLFLMTLLGIILQDKQDLQNQLYQMLGEVMPGAAFELVRKTLEEVTAHATGGKLALVY
jgi:membrane protein